MRDEAAFRICNTRDKLVGIAFKRLAFKHIATAKLLRIESGNGDDQPCLGEFLASRTPNRLRNSVLRRSESQPRWAHFRKPAACHQGRLESTSAGP